MTRVKLTAEEMTCLVRQTVRNMQFRWISTYRWGDLITGLAAHGLFFYCE